MTVLPDIGFVSSIRDHEPFKVVRFANDSAGRANLADWHLRFDCQQAHQAVRESKNGNVNRKFASAACE